MPNRHLSRPSAAFRTSYLSALREGFRGANDGTDTKTLEEAEADFGAHLSRLDRDGQSRHFEEGREFASVPSCTYWLVEGSEFLGAVSIRARIDSPLLAYFGGHIGYGIRPSARRKGNGSLQLRLALDICRGMGVGMGIVRIGCKEKNEGSRRIIEGNGGVLLRRSGPQWYCKEPFLLFEVPLVDAP